MTPTSHHLTPLIAVVLLAGCATATHTSAHIAAPTSVPTPQSAAPSPTATPTPTATTAASSPAASPTPAVPAPPAAPVYTFPVRGCRVSYGHVHHDYPATDIFAPRGCTFVAVTDGRIDQITRVDTWSSTTNAGASRGGLSVSIVGRDGVRYYGSHLSRIAPGLLPGRPVHAGDVLGLVGDSGDARGVGTHVHFGISWPSAPQAWWVRRGELYPWPYLDSWTGGGQKSPAPAVAVLRQQRGRLPPCTVHC